MILAHFCICLKLITCNSGHGCAVKGEEKLVHFTCKIKHQNIFVNVFANVLLLRDARIASAIYCCRKLVVRPSVALRYRGHICGVGSKVITRIISLGSSLLGATTSAIYSLIAQALRNKISTVL